jgi:hypothetical protein
MARNDTQIYSNRKGKSENATKQEDKKRVLSLWTQTNKQTNKLTNKQKQEER